MRPSLFRAAALAAAMAVAGAAAEEPTAPEPLIARWREQNGLCRGLHGDDPRMPPACAERQRLGRALDALGWCYGRREQMGYQMEWHRCGPDSLHPE